MGVAYPLLPMLEAVGAFLPLRLSIYIISSSSFSRGAWGCSPSFVVPDERDGVAFDRGLRSIEERRLVVFQVAFA